MSLSFSEEFMETLEGYFYRIKNDILNYINSRLKNITKYNLNEQIIKSNFFLIEKINEEINTLIENMENIFSEENFIMKIKLPTINTGTNLIKSYHETKEKELSNFYDNTRKRMGDNIWGCSSDLMKRTRKRKKLKGYLRKYYENTHFYCKSRNNINKININL